MRGKRIMLSEQDIRRNILDVENAIAQQRLEGLEPSGALIADLIGQRMGRSPSTTLSRTSRSVIPAQAGIQKE
jgi:hypothetical protein